MAWLPRRSVTAKNKLVFTKTAAPRATLNPCVHPKFTKMGKNRQDRVPRRTETRNACHRWPRYTPTCLPHEARSRTAFAVIPRTDGRNRLLFEVMYRYGLRRQEVALIRRDYIGSASGSCGSRGGVSGEYPIHPMTRRLLWEYFEQLGAGARAYLFTTRQSESRPIFASTIYQLVRWYAEAAGLPHDRSHPHVLRHRSPCIS